MEEKPWSGKELADGFRRLADWFEKQERLKQSFPGQGIEVWAGLQDADAVEEALTLGGSDDYETFSNRPSVTRIAFGAVRPEEFDVYLRPVFLRLYSAGDIDGD